MMKQLKKMILATGLVLISLILVNCSKGDQTSPAGTYTLRLNEARRFPDVKNGTILQITAISFYCPMPGNCGVAPPRNLIVKLIGNKKNTEVLVCELGSCDSKNPSTFIYNGVTYLITLKLIDYSVYSATPPITITITKV